MPQALYKSRLPTRGIPYNHFNRIRPRNPTLPPPITTTIFQTKDLRPPSASAWRAHPLLQRSPMALPTSLARKACQLPRRDRAVLSSSSPPRMTSYLSTSRRRRISPGSKLPTSSPVAALAPCKCVTVRSSRRRRPSGRMRW